MGHWARVRRPKALGPQAGPRAFGDPGRAYGLALCPVSHGPVLYPNSTWLSAKTYVNLSSSWGGHTVDLYQPLVFLLVLANLYREGTPGLWGGPNGYPRGPPGEPAFGQLGLERPQSVELAIPGLYRDASREGPTDWNLEDRLRRHRTS